MSSEKPLVETVERLPRLKDEWDSEGIWGGLDAFETQVEDEFGPVLNRFQAIRDDQLVVLRPGFKYITGLCEDEDQWGGIVIWVLEVAR